MKKNIFTLIAILVASCSSTPLAEEMAISDYVQTIGNTKTEMNFKLIELTEIEPITGVDSAAVIMERNKEYSRRMAEANLRKYEALLDAQFSFKESVRLKIDGAKAKLIKTNEEIKELEVYFDKYDSDSTGFETFAMLKGVYDRYNSNPDSIFARRYKCVYSIKNPLLNGAKQQSTKVFVLSPDGSKVLASEDI